MGDRILKFTQVHNFCHHLPLPQRTKTDFKNSFTIATIKFRLLPRGASHYHSATAQPAEHWTELCGRLIKIRQFTHSLLLTRCVDVSSIKAIFLYFSLQRKASTNRNVEYREKHQIRRKQLIVSRFIDRPFFFLFFFFF